MKTYTVHVTRGEHYWLVHVPEVERSTQARHLREVEVMAADLIAAMTDSEPDSFALDVDVRMPDGVNEHLRRAEKYREEARSAQAAAAEEVRTAAHLLRDRGMPLRDVGQLLNVSYQRVAQLLSSHKQPTSL